MKDAKVQTFILHAMEISLLYSIPASVYQKIVFLASLKVFFITALAPQDAGHGHRLAIHTIS